MLGATVSGKRLNEVVRSHWDIENCLHGKLNVVMNEDQASNRLGYGPQNHAVLRHMVLKIMQKDPTKGSLRGTFKRAR